MEEKKLEKFTVEIEVGDEIWVGGITSNIPSDWAMAAVEPESPATKQGIWSLTATVKTSAIARVADVSI